MPSGAENVAPSSVIVSRLFHLSQGSQPKYREPPSDSIHSPTANGPSDAFIELRSHGTLNDLCVRGGVARVFGGQWQVSEDKRGRGE